MKPDLNLAILSILLAAMIGCASATATLPTASSPVTRPVTIEGRTASLERIDGFVPLYWDATEGKMYLEIDKLGEEILYQVSLPAGVGSNPIGLDRNQLGGTYVVRFERVGPKVLMIESNYSYRADSDEPMERKAVRDSFAESVLWGFAVDAESDGRLLVDATSFFLRDAHGVASALARAEQGTYGLDESRSVFYLPRTKGFPKNTELEVTLTFTSGAPGNLVWSVTPTGYAITVRQHHSFVELPDDGYTPRKFDPRVGVYGIDFYDYATPVSEPIVQRWISRHRIEKKNPEAAISEPVEPIVYYLDNGTPEPIRSALLDGARWWNQAFEAAGFREGFRVEVLPDDADPMDLRYNMISWVHRSTRGWSYGSSVVDPRTGEIIKGNVSLGSLRVRQDYLLGTGLVPLFDEILEGPRTDYLATLDRKVNPVEMALARIRQLSAHEVGHTLGLAHNFAASTYGRASVMDYPAPLIEIENGKLDLSNAYDVGIGEYDKFAIRYGYSQFAPGADEDTELAKIVEEGIAGGMLYITDGDARPAGAAHPLASLWDNGADPIAMLAHEMEVRRIALEQFGLGNIPEGEPVSSLEAVLLPLYLHHRYQVEAAMKSIGGVHYTYSLKTNAGPVPSEVREIVSPELQRKALSAVMDTLNVNALKLPSSVLALIPPPAWGYEHRTIELFERRTSPTFDSIGAATIAADIAIGGLLEPNRAARLIEFHALESANPGFDHVLESLLGLTWYSDRRDDEYEALIQRAVQNLVVTRLMELSANERASTEVRALATNEIRKLAESIKARPGPGRGTDRAHRLAVLDDITRFLERPDSPRQQTIPLGAPPGSPIGN